MLDFYRFLTGKAAPALEFLLKARLKAGKEDQARLDERRGITAAKRPRGPLVWIHAASVGEVQSARILMTALLEHSQTLNILITTGTVTSAGFLQKDLPARCLHQFYPLDHPEWVKSFIDHWRPDLALWMESELWPNMLGEIQARAIPAILVNARLSANSYGKWRLFKSGAKKILGAFSLILAQTPADESRFKNLGAAEILVTDNLKYSARPLPADEADLQNLQNAIQNRPCWLFASTHKGEEEMACRLHLRLKGRLPNLLTIIVPRHPQRREEIVSLCAGYGAPALLRGEAKTLPTDKTGVYIGDTMGELGLFYRVAPIACIGRSFSDDGGGGHNPIEAAQLGCAVLHGPKVQFQKQIYDEMNRSGAALKVPDERTLMKMIYTLLTDAQKRETLHQRGGDFARSKEQVIGRVWSALTPYIEKLEKSEKAA